LPGPKKLIRPNLAISSFKKGQILKNEEMPNFAQKFVEIKRFNVRISKILLTFALIFPKLALQYSILFNIKKMANVPNHFTSGIQSQKRSNDNPVTAQTRKMLSLTALTPRTPKKHIFT